MRTIAFIATIFTAPALLAEDSAPAPVPAREAAASPALAADPNDPAEIQRRFVKTINDAIKKAEVGLKTPQKKRFHSGGRAETYYAEYTGKLSFDIKKTDSIVSPYLGFVRWEIRWYCNGELVDIPMSLDAHYAYQNGQWVFKDLVRHYENERFGVRDLPANEYLTLFK